MKYCLELYSSEEGANYVSDNIAKGRRIYLRGIDVCFVQDGDELRMDPVIPCVAPLHELIQQTKGDTTFIFDRKTKEWNIGL